MLQQHLHRLGAALIDSFVNRKITILHNSRQSTVHKVKRQDHIYLRRDIWIGSSFQEDS